MLAPVKQFRKCVLDTVIYLLQRRTKDSVTAIWLIYCLNCCQFSPYIWFSNYMFISFQSLLLSKAFVTQGRPGRLKLSTNKRQVEDTEVGDVCPRKPHRVLLGCKVCSYNQNTFISFREVRFCDQKRTVCQKIQYKRPEGVFTLQKGNTHLYQTQG